MNIIKKFECKLFAIEKYIDEIGSSVGCVSIALCNNNSSSGDILTSPDLLEKLQVLRVECKTLVKLCDTVVNSIKIQEVDQ